MQNRDLETYGDYRGEGLLMSEVPLYAPDPPVKEARSERLKGDPQVGYLS